MARLRPCQGGSPHWLAEVARYGAISILLSMSALFSGLNIGLINLDPTELEVRTQGRSVVVLYVMLCCAL